MKYYKVELINDKVYDFNKECRNMKFDHFGFTVFAKKDTSDPSDVLMIINKFEIRKIEVLDDSEEVEILNNQESKIEWITDRLPTKE